jgi:hypothetical protein
MNARYVEALGGIVLVVAVIAMVWSGSSGTLSTTSTTAVTTTIGYSSSGTINASQQQSIAQGNGLSLPSSYFSCSYNSDCERVRIAACNNNLPSQSACINKEYYPEYSALYNSSMIGHHVFCPDYIIYENISCTCAANTCVENYGP